MSENTKREYNKWYWDIIAQPALQRVVSLCKSSNRNFNFTASKDDFIDVLKYLKEWEKTISINESISNDLFVIRNFEGYEEAIAA